MKRRLIGILVAVIILGGLAVGGIYMWRTREPVEPTVVGPPGPAREFPDTGYPGQDIAFANPLHAAHVNAVPSVACVTCHAYRPDDPDPGHRCLQCHENKWSAIHAAVKDEHARECLSCHDFLHLGPKALDPWACPACHVGDDYTGPRKLPNAPKITLHAKENCGMCHKPHSQPALQVRSCVECHKNERTEHGGPRRKGAQKCLDCHSMHEAGGAAERHCRKCHEHNVSNRATFPGHTTCVGCHKPHGFTKKTAAECRDCHKGQTTLAANKVPEHAKCENCHKPHDVKSSLSSCDDSGCHAKKNPAHPPDKALGECLGCHNVHPTRQRPRVGTESCTECHAKGKPQNAFHAKGTECRDCHIPHERMKLTANATFCRTCHAKQVGDAAPIRTSKGHSTCSECHKNAGHDPTEPRPACTSCHDEQARTAPEGHRDCKNCHTTHEAKVKKQATCTSSACHKRSQWGGHHEKIDGGCRNCHRPHGPKGPAKPPGCLDCHKRPELPGLHQHQDHGKCTDCHQPHDQRTLGVRKRCTDGCHQDMKRHEPEARSCIACHPFGGGGL